MAGMSLIEDDVCQTLTFAGKKENKRYCIMQIKQLYRKKKPAKGREVNLGLFLESARENAMSEFFPCVRIDPTRQIWKNIVQMQ